MTDSCRKKIRFSSAGGVRAGGGAGDDDRAARLQRLQRVRPGRLADGFDDRVDPFGQPRAGVEGGVAPSRRGRCLLVLGRGGAPHPVAGRRASAISAVATPPPAPCTSTVWPGRRPEFTNSIR